MIRDCLNLFVLLHLVGDYYAQTESLSAKKKEKFGALILHAVIYTAVMLVGCALFAPAGLLVCALILSAAHFAIDTVKFAIEKRTGASQRQPLLYVADQIFHLLSLAVCALLFVNSSGPAGTGPLLGAVAALTGADIWKVLSMICLTLLICKPANITIKNLLARYRPESADQATLANAGAYIGVLERIIIALLIGTGQYAAIGLVLTAKSIARYDKISKDQKFSEYYLLGTLLSTLFVIAACFLFGVS